MLLKLLIRLLILDLIILNIYHLPTLLTKIEINSHNNRKIILEIVQHLGNIIVHCIALNSIDVIYHVLVAINTKRTIMIPVGKEILGRILNVFGGAINGQGDINDLNKSSI